MATLRRSSDIRFKNEFENDLMREMLLTEEQGLAKDRVENLLQTYLQMRWNMASAHGKFEERMTSPEIRQQFADYLKDEVIRELRLDVDPAVDFETKFSYGSLVKNKEIELFEKERYGRPEIRSDNYLEISFEEKREKEGKYFADKHELASGMTHDVGYDHIARNMPNMQYVEVDSKPREFGRFEEAKSYDLKGSGPQGLEINEPNQFEAWLKEYYVDVRKQIANAKKIDKILINHFAQTPKTVEPELWEQENEKNRISSPLARDDIAINPNHEG